MSDYPSLRAASRHLGFDLSRLIVQIDRIERDRGTQLLIRARPGHPMHLTADGTHLVADQRTRATTHVAFTRRTRSTSGLRRRSRTQP